VAALEVAEVGREEADRLTAGGCGLEPLLVGDRSRGQAGAGGEEKGEKERGEGGSSGTGPASRRW